ncbi:hypothetical protein BC827DRAFT_1162449 [Russula dissimulans]|nr:hypothetical protein BC827DRAFT_1162449 [Russula dissimulans]
MSSEPALWLAHVLSRCMVIDLGGPSGGQAARRRTPLAYHSDEDGGAGVSFYRF